MVTLPRGCHEVPRRGDMLNAVADILPKVAGDSGKNNATLEHTCTECVEQANAAMHEIHITLHRGEDPRYHHMRVTLQADCVILTRLD